MVIIHSTVTEVENTREIINQVARFHPFIYFELIELEIYNKEHNKMISQVLHLWIFVFCIPDVGAGAHAIIGVVARRLVYPLPAQVFPEIDVQASHTAGLSLAASQRTRKNEVIGPDASYSALAEEYFTEQ